MDAGLQARPSGPRPSSVGALQAESFPLCVHRPEDTVAWSRAQRISCLTFLSHVEHVARQLPGKGHAVNLCDDRYHFLVTFCAVLLRRQTNALPHGRTDAAIAECARQFPDSYLITDNHIDGVAYSLGTVSGAGSLVSTPEIPGDHTAAVLFTSGTTGVPRAHSQSWSNLLARASVTRDRLRIEPQASIIATVPPQHMFGLETSVMLPLVSRACTDARRPFFPSDVRDALSLTHAPRVLAITPVHLRACLDARLQWPDVRFLLSATAPLSVPLAERAEQTFRAPLLEIYGSTETGAIATRRTAKEDSWCLCDGLALSQHEGQIRLTGPWLREGFVLQDQVEPTGVDRLRLLGRSCDLVNIAGKRGSLADLTNKLLDIDGVVDGVLLADDESGRPLPRLSGLVVAPGLSKREVIRALARQVDPVFLPRPLYMVSELNRNASGKLPDRRIHAMLKTARRNCALETREVPQRVEVGSELRRKVRPTFVP